MDISLLIAYIPLGFLAISTLVLVFFWKDYYFIYDHRLFLVIGLEFSRSLTDFAIISVLICYFTSNGDDLAMSAILTNIQSSLSSLLVILMARAANSYVGRFHALLFSNTAYVGGLMLLWLFNPYDVKWLVVISLVLLSIGTSGANILQDVLKDLVNDVDKSQDHTKTRSLARAAIWSRTAYVLGVFSAMLWVPTGALQWVPPIDWESSFLICIITMAAALTLFCTGYNIYHQGELLERPAEVFFRVFCARFKELLKFNSRQDRSPKNVGTEKVANEGIPKERPPLRLNTKPRGSSSYKQKDIVLVKRLLRMFPMWGMSFVVALISAVGSTFFLQQCRINLDGSNSVHGYGSETGLNGSAG